MASLFDVALTDMRKPGMSAEDYENNHSATYALNDDLWWLRNPGSGFSYRAAVTMGRWPNINAWNASINPNYGEMTWVPEEFRAYTWPSAAPWFSCVLGSTYQLNHLPGFANNTHVMVWGFQTWIKSLSSGQWVQRTNSDAFGGGWYGTVLAGTDFYGDIENSPQFYRIETSTGYGSFKLPTFPSNPSLPYWTCHGWAERLSIDPWDVADVLMLCKTSLVVDDSWLADDRDYSRFLFSLGGDYYPDTGVTQIYPAIGGARHKYVRAKWPNWQYHVLHTMTEPEMNATGGFPAALMGLSEGDGSGGGGGGGGGGSTIVAPTRGEWQLLTEGGAGGWGASGVANTPENKIRRRRGAKIWS